MSKSSSEENLSTEGELREQVKQLLDENAELKRTIDKQQEEIKHLKTLLLGVDDIEDGKRKRKHRSRTRHSKSMSVSLPQSPMSDKKIKEHCT